MDKSVFPLVNYYKIFNNRRVIYQFSILITINKEINISSINRCPRGKTVGFASGRGGNASGGGGTNVAT